MPCGVGRPPAARKWWAWWASPERRLRRTANTANSQCAVSCGQRSATSPSPQAMKSKSPRWTACDYASNLISRRKRSEHESRESVCPAFPRTGADPDGLQCLARIRAGRHLPLGTAGPRPRRRQRTGRRHHYSVHRQARARQLAHRRHGRPPTGRITRDNVTVKVNAVIYFRVVDQERAIIQVEDYLYATSMMSQTTLRSVLGQSQLDDLLSKREQINAELQRIIDQQTEPWGVKVTAVEVKNVDLPQEMQRAIARQAEAERERRAKVIHAEGEFEASRRLADAADVISRNPVALQLRYLQTLVEIAAEKNSTTIFPIPIDTIAPFFKHMGKAEPS